MDTVVCEEDEHETGRKKECDSNNASSLRLSFL